MNRKGQAGIAIGIAVFFVAALIYAVVAWDEVGAREYGIKDTFGVVDPNVLPSGLWYTGFFTTTHRFPSSTQSMVLENVDAVDKSGQDVFATIAINYKIIDKDAALKLYKEVGDENQVAETLNLNHRVQEGFKQVTAQYDSIEVLEKRDDVKKAAEVRIEALFPKQYYVLESVVVSKIHYGDDFTKSIEMKKVAEQQALQAEANVKTAQAQADQQIQAARGQAEAQKLQSLTITQDYLTLKYIEKWDGHLPQVQAGTSPLIFDVSKVGAK